MNLVDTPEMAVFFERLDRMDKIQLLAMRAAWQSTSHQAHEYAWAAVREIGARDGLAKELDRVRDRAMTWVLRGTNSIPYWGDNDNRVLVKGEASEAIVDAALAVALGSRLDGSTRSILLGPWLRATEAVG
ncbi:MAG: hypothetical protein ABSG37_03360 [Candidatus Limnocylindrales bacterium]